MHFNVKHTVKEESKAQAYLFWQAAPTLSLLLSTFSCSTLKLALDMVSANTASSEPQCYKKSNESQDARRWSPNILNEPLQQ